MSVLLDTSVLARLANISDPQYATATRAVEELADRGEQLHVAPQNLIEFRNAATRPLTANGLGFGAVTAEQQVAAFESAFGLIAETADIYPAWKSLVAATALIGKQVHDARIVAICSVTGISHLLTFNVRHFARLAPHVRHLTVIDPASV